jgi:hypothetical protein
MQKKWMLNLLFSITIFSIPLVRADFGDTMSNVFGKIVGIGNLGFLGMADTAIVLGVTRLLIWVFVFTIIYAVIAVASGNNNVSLGFLKKNHALVVALVMATITSIFLPPEVLLAVGSGWATIVAFVLIGAPVVGIAFLLWKIPGKGEETRFTLFLKFVLCCLLFWVLTAMKYHINHLMGGSL